MSMVSGMSRAYGGMVGMFATCGMFGTEGKFTVGRLGKLTCGLGMPGMGISILKSLKGSMICALMELSITPTTLFSMVRLSGSMMSVSSLVLSGLMIAVFRLLGMVWLITVSMGAPATFMPS